MNERLDELLQCCTVKLKVPGKVVWGSGFLVAPGRILTCAHVVKEVKLGGKVQVSGKNETSFPEATLAKSLPDYDLALLYFSPPPTDNLPCVYLSSEFQPYDKFYTFGYSDQFPDGTSVTSKCEGETFDKKKLLILFNSGQIRPGISGSPLLNLRTGKVCGIVKFTRDRSFDLGGGAVPTSEILSQFPELEELQQAFHKQDSRWTNLLQLVPEFSNPLITIAENIKGSLDFAKQRKQLLKVVDRYVKERFKDCFHKQVKINLLLEECHEQVGRHPLPTAEPSEESSENLMDIFKQDDIQGKLLILGAAGSGKTIMLLTMADNLLKRAEADSTQPIPIILDLSTWKDGKQPIKQWVIARLQKEYNVQIDFSQYLLKNQQLSLLLDGLDMLGLKRQIECVKAINSFVEGEETNLLDLMVCCRLKEYKEAWEEYNGVKLKLHGAICLKSLTDTQIKRYLEDLRKKDLGDLRSIRLWNNIQQSQKLAELARIPLYLTIMIPTVQKRIIETEQELLDGYIDDRLKLETQRKKQRTRNYLSWLARKMQRGECEREFFIDQMQLTWLESSSQKRSYSLAIGITIGLIWSITWGLIYLLIKGTTEGINVGLITFGYVSFISTLPLLLLFELGRINSQKLRKNIKQLIYSFGIGSAGLLFWFLLIQLFISWQNALILALIVALITGLHDALTGGEKGKAFDNIIPVSSFRKFPKSQKIKKVLLAWILFATLLGLFMGGFKVLDKSLIFWLTRLFIGGLIGGIGNLIVISKSKIERELIPNQGIWNSAKSSAIFTLVGVLGLGLFARIADIPILWGIVLGGITGFYRGGSVCIQHFILRLILYVNGKIPWNYQKFLDDAEKLRLIQKVGGSYRFLHQSLQEYFAKMH